MENTMLPKVSIIIPYNRNRGWLYDCVRSVFASDYKGQIEVILSKSDAGVSTNINKAIEVATGDYIKFIAEDDMITANCISDSLEAIKSHDVIHGKAYYIKDGAIVNSFTPNIHEPTLNQMLTVNRLHGGTLFYKASVLKENLFDESLWTGEEYELNLRLLKQGIKFGYCDSFLTYNRLHSEQKSIGNKAIEYQRKRAKEIERIKRMYWI
jgi:glycosyltransferase involved in cell wall biosynthesis